MFDPSRWEGKAHSWKGKKFIRETVPQLFHIPFPPMIGQKITRMWKMACEVKMASGKEDALVLFYDPSPFKSEIYLSVKGAVPGADNVELSGNYYSKVFDGPYNAVPKFINEMDQFLQKKGKAAKKYYIHYASCPKCAKEQGHNYLVMFAEV